ncbi:ParM/StbA family protein [Priestia flexa]|uniref:ParM/StbA family protein n=1 Tax=Priestia flexa TaxID=86664 RepID=UPI003D01888F
MKSYEIDLGNGFTKRLVGSEVVTEPSVIAKRPNYYTTDNDLVSLSLDKDEKYYVGKDAVKSNAPLIAALGDDDDQRYTSQEFQSLLYGFIAKDLKEDTTIPLLVTGLPVNHYTSQAATVMQRYKGAKVVHVNDKEIVINVKDVHVLPQPLGTYMYLLSEEKIEPEARTLIIDGGYGTTDVTELTGHTIVKRAGDDLGVKNAYNDILMLIVDKFGSKGTKNLTLSQMPYVLEKGFKSDGQLINVSELPEVKKVLDEHFTTNFNFVRDRGFDLYSYDYVVWTGGMAELHKERIESKKRKNFIVLEDGQEANVKGYGEYAKSVLAGD